MVSRAKHSATTQTISWMPTRFHAPELMPSLKATYTTMMIAARSKILNPRPLRSIKPESQRRDNWPRMKGSSRIATIVTTALPLSWATSLPTKTATSSGVSATPRRFEREAPTTAPAILPRAMEVIVIDDWTVEGRKQMRSCLLYTSDAADDLTRVDLG